MMLLHLELALRLLYIIGAKEILICLNYEVSLRSFLKKYILYLRMWAWYREKIVGVQEVIHF